MTPPAAPRTVQDPLHEELAPPPPVAQPTADIPPPVQPAPVVSPRPAQPAQPATEGEPSEAWKRLHLVIGGHYTFGGVTLHGDAEPFSSAAAGHHGGGLLIQPSYSVVRSKWFDLNLGLNLHQTWLSVPRSAGSVSSDISATTIGGLVEGNVFFHEHVGLGLNATLGYMGLSSSNADVGAPFSASLNFDGNVALGSQLYLHFWRNAFRVGGGVNWMAGGFGLQTSPGNPDLLVSMDPMWSVFLGVDPLQIIRNATGRAGERPQ